MNITEANATATVLRFATGHMPCTSEDVDRLADAAGYLADRVNKALAAGPRPADVERDVRAHVEEWLLDADCCCENRHGTDGGAPLLETVPVAGGRL